MFEALIIFVVIVVVIVVIGGAVKVGIEFQDVIFGGLVVLVGLGAIVGGVALFVKVGRALGAIGLFLALFGLLLVWFGSHIIRNDL